MRRRKLRAMGGLWGHPEEGVAPDGFFLKEKGEARRGRSM